MARKQLVQKLRPSFTRLARPVDQLMCEQLGCGPVTAQQCYTLGTPMDDPQSMENMASELALRQRTLTRIVEKPEKGDLVHRTRKSGNHRSMEVNIIVTAKQTYLILKDAKSQMISDLLDLIPKKRHASVVGSMEELAALLNSENREFQRLFNGCDSYVPPGGDEK